MCSLQVGFLKTQHRYEIVFMLPEVPGLGKDVCPAPVPNPYLQIKDLTAAPSGMLPLSSSSFCYFRFFFSVFLIHGGLLHQEIDHI